MNDIELDKSIEDLRKRKLPACPPNLEANVLRRVRMGRSEAEDNVWVWLGALIPKTGFAVATLALVALTSSMVTVVSASAYASGLERQAQANRALDLGFMTTTELIHLADD